jgi:hypothetical protein
MEANDRDQLRQRLLAQEFSVSQPPPYTVFQAWSDYGTPHDWREAIAFAALPFLEYSPAFKALQAEWSDACDRLRDEAPPSDHVAIAQGLAPRAAWSVADHVNGQLVVLACEIGAIAGFALSAAWTGEIADLPDWLARAVGMADVATYARPS